MNKIIGHTLSTPVAKSNWNETNEKRSSFIENKPPLKNGADGIPYFETPVIVETPTADNHATTKGYVDNAVASAVNIIKQSDLRSVIRSDSSVAVTKEVPANAMPTAQVRIIGGMSYPSDVVSKNLCDINTLVPLAPVVIKGGTVTVENGVATFTVDGTYTIEGTPYVELGSVRNVFPYFESGKIYNISYDSVPTFPDGIYPNMMFFLRNSSGVLGLSYGQTEMYMQTCTFAADDTNLSFMLLAKAGTVSNLMVTEGNTPLPYEPYTVYEDTKVTAVESVGKNLIDPGRFVNKTVNGVTIRSNADGSVNLNGVCTVSGIHTFGTVVLPPNKQVYTAKAFGTETWPTTGTLFYVTSASSSGPYANSAGVCISREAYGTCNVRVHLYAGIDYTGCKLYPMLVRGEVVPTEFEPYRKTTLPIPAEVQALDGYGIGRDATAYNHIRCDENGSWEYVRKVDDNLNLLATPEVTDISDLMTEDNLLRVYEGGTIVMANSNAKDVPSTIDYQFIEFA